MDENDRKDLVKELQEMKRLGIKVSKKALDHAKTDDLSDYECISIADLASLFCEMYN